MLGGPKSPEIKTTEVLDVTTGKWSSGFALKSNLYTGCAVHVAPDTAVTIAGLMASSRQMYSYNIATNKSRMYRHTPPTEVSGCNPLVLGLPNVRICHFIIGCLLIVYLVKKPVCLDAHYSESHRLVGLKIFKMATGFIASRSINDY